MMDPEKQYEKEFQERQRQRQQEQQVQKEGKKAERKEKHDARGEKVDKGLQAAQVAAEAAQPELAPIIKGARIALKHKKSIIAAAIGIPMAVILVAVMAVMIIVTVIIEPAEASCGTAGGNDITRFLQALSDHETGGTGDPTTPPNSGGASGKYQYVDRTWAGTSERPGVTDTYYPPAIEFPSAYLAPEDMQDAVAYLEYSKKFKDLGGDLFKLAVSHYYPLALTDPSKMDIVPRPEAGNVLTPREYGEKFVEKIQAGAGSHILINPTTAPKFVLIALVQGAPIFGSSATGGTGCTGGNGGSIVQKALLYAWNDLDEHTESTPEYEAALAQYDPGGDPTDCGRFVSIVMRSSGADPSYPPVGTSLQYDYVKLNPDKYTVLENVVDVADLLPGDIVIWRNPGDGFGHTLIFVGPQPAGFSATDASLNGHVPQGEANPASTLSKPGAIVARYKGGI